MNWTDFEVENKFDVPKRQWKKWVTVERYTFNSLYEQMTERADLFLHPEGYVDTYEHWKTTAWNAAWMAADNLRLLRKGKV